MTTRTVSTLKFVGSISLGLLTGLSYTLSSLTLPSLLTLPSASSASRAFTNLTNVSLTHLHALVGISSSSFLLAYLFSPKDARHPYLLWTTLFTVGSGLTDFYLPSQAPKTIANTSEVKKEKKIKQRRMDASYEVLGAGDRDSEGTASGEEFEEEVNGEEVRVQMEGFQKSQTIRTAIAGVGFMMSVVGIWGDGGSAVDVVIIA